MTYQERSFYGNIPANATKPEVVALLINGLRRFLDKVEYAFDRQTVFDIFDRWCEHDAVRQDVFDHLLLENEDTVNHIVDSAMEGLDLSDKKGTWADAPDEYQDYVHQELEGPFADQISESDDESDDERGEGDERSESDN